MDEAAQHPDDDAYASFVDRFAPATLKALSAVVGRRVDAWQDHSMHRADDPLALLVTLDGPPAVVLELFTPQPGDRALFAGDHIGLSYRKGRDGADPNASADGRALIEAARSAVRAADQAETPVAALRKAVTEQRAFGPVADWMYRQAGPEPALIRLGFRCNQDCWFCWQGRDWPEPPVAMYHHWLEEFAAAGRTRVSFSGGEPTLHRALPELVARATALGMTALIQTNAIQLSKPKILERLVEAGLHGAFVSYHSPDPATSDAMTRAPGTHPRTQKGIAAALAAGLDIEINCVVERANYQQLEAHAADVLTRFVDPFPNNPVSLVSYSHPCEYYDLEVWKQSSVGLDAVRPHLIAALTMLHARGVRVEGIGTCGFPPCLLKDEPELLRWLVPEEQNAMDVTGRTYAPACDRCSVKARCMGLRREYVDLVGYEGVRPFE